MKTLKTLVTLSVFALFGTLALTAHAEEAKKVSTTLEALQAAYNGESNASAKYAAYAKKADEEGYAEVASLFRATSKAEAIHAASDASIIKSMKAEPKLTLATPAPKTTKENLEDAIKGETYEVTTMYPEFISLAEKDKNQGALMVFGGAKATEAEHAKLYQAALDKLPSLKGGPAKEFFVCPICGYTVAVLEFEKCPICGEEKADFLKVK
jgi:rubrerythrin